MADSGSLRVRRHRLHARGDHSLCKRCGALRAVVAVPAAGGAPAGPADWQAALERQAQRLEETCEADLGNPALERELRATLLALRGPGEAADGELAKFWADFRGA